MKHKPMIKIITVLSAAAMLTGAVSVSASAAVIDDDQAAAMLDLSETQNFNDKVFRLEYKKSLEVPISTGEKEKEL